MGYGTAANMSRAPLLQIVLILVHLSHISGTVQFSVPEEQEPGVLAGSLSKHFSPPYKLLTDNYLKLDENSGNLFTKERMDREALCPKDTRDTKCTFTQNAIVGPTKDLIQFHLIIEDINDNAPHFENSEIHLGLSEDVTVGTGFLLDDLAQDWDIGSNGDIQYQIEGSDGVFDLEVDSDTVKLVVQKPLDRETQNLYNMTLLANDRGTPSLASHVALIVEVTDVNDNCPTFSSDNPRNVTISGDSPKNILVARLTATDADLGSNAAITYSLSPKVSDRARTLFSLDSLTGSITLTEDLQSDMLEELILKVEASSLHCPPADTQVTVSVLPRAKDEPTIKMGFIARHENQTLMIPENEPPTVLAVLELEGDRGLEDSSLSIVGEVPFTLNPWYDKYRLSTVRPLDYEMKSEYEIFVILRRSAGGSVTTTSHLVIKVQVTDVNDNQPIFQHSHYEIKVEENNPPGIALLQVYASDADSGNNSKITYKLGEQVPTIFTIDLNTGQLFASVPLDREQQPVHNIIVFAEDSGSPPLKTMAMVSIQVLDRNDNAPVFVIPHFIFLIPENLPVLAQVGKVWVTDADEAENGETEIHVVNSSGSFGMDNSSRTLRITASLNRETQDRYEFWLVATDHGSPPLTSSAKVTVYIEDINDNQPKVIIPKSNRSCLTVSPATSTGTMVTRIYAVDEDSGLNSELTFTVVNQSKHFQVDSKTGYITLVQKLLGQDWRMHNIFVVVSDRGKPSPLHTAVWVNLLVNDSLEPCYFDRELEEPPWPAPTSLGTKWYAPNQESMKSKSHDHIILFIGLGMMIVSICLFAVTVVLYRKQSERRTQKETKVHTKENEIPLKLIEKYYSDE